MRSSHRPASVGEDHEAGATATNGGTDDHRDLARLGAWRSIDAFAVGDRHERDHRAFEDDGAHAGLGRPIDGQQHRTRRSGTTRAVGARRRARRFVLVRRGRRVIVVAVIGGLVRAVGRAVALGHRERARRAGLQRHERDDDRQDDAEVTREPSHVAKLWHARRQCVNPAGRAPDGRQHRTPAMPRR